MQWGAELFQFFPCSSFKEWQKAIALVQKVVANQILLWGDRGKCWAGVWETRRGLWGAGAKAGHGEEKMKLIKGLSTVRNPKLQNQAGKRGNPPFNHLREKNIVNLLQGKLALCLHWASALQTKPSWDTMVFWGNTIKDHFLLQQTGLEDTRPSLEPVQLKHVVCRPCTTRCCFFREMGKKSLSFHFYPTCALLSSSCISPRTATIEELKLLLTTDPRQWLITIISSD